MADAAKDTIYIDIDDEITAIIDKLQASNSKVVALVLPKRATTLQSIVNMKLLKRAGEQANKNLVLVTTEAGLLPLAGAVGMHVAATPSSRPEIPVAPNAATPSGLDDIEEVDLSDSIATAADRSVGELADSTIPVPAKPTAASGVETLELDNTAAPAAANAAPKSKLPKKDKKLHVPNFNRFRLLLIFGVILIFILGVGGYFALAVLPKATINVQTNASNVNANVDFTLSTNATDYKSGSKTLPAKRVQSQKTLTGTAPATGQKNNGDKATGSVTMTLCTNNPSATNQIPSGTGISSGGKTYITQDNTNFQYNGNCSGGFRFKSSDVSISAQSAGASFNTSNNASFSVSGRNDITASGSASGGSDDIQTVVSQSDIDTAKGKIASGNDSSAQSDLSKQLQDQGLYAITATYNSGTPAVTSSSNVGDQTSNVTVTEVVTYTMLGTNIENIKSLVNNDIKSQIDTSKQSILNQGITQGSFKQNAATASGATMNIQTTAVVGPMLNTEDIASAAAGKKAGDIKSEISGYTGVTDVQVKLSPFWVSKAPSKTSKITVNIAKPTNDPNDN